MIHESYPWKQDLLKNRALIRRYNKASCFENDDEGTYTIIEKAIFYSAFIIRKLIDCRSKLSDEAESYSLSVYSIRPLKRVDRMHHWPESSSHDWNKEQPIAITGKALCNSLIHSFVFFAGEDENGVVNSFFVCSDYDKQKNLYRVPLEGWLEYMSFIASDSVVEARALYSQSLGDYVYTKKLRG